MITFCMILLFCLLSQGVFSQPTVSTDKYEFCRHGNVEFNEIGTRYQIASQGYPNLVPDEPLRSSDCSMYIKVCPHCRIRVTIAELLMPNCNEPILEQGSCHAGCDHLYLHEPDYPEETHTYVFRRSGMVDRDFENWSLTTHTRNLFIKFCRTTKKDANMAFALYIDVEDKSETFYDTTSGAFQSPFFPDAYHAYVGYDEYRFVLMPPRDNYRGSLFINCTDWHLMDQSYIEIVDRGRTLIRHNSYDDRPMLKIDNPYRVTIVFYTGRTSGGTFVTDVHPKPGFRIQFEFAERYWNNQNIHVCGGSILNTFGGQFEIDGSKDCSENDQVDCVWVVNRMNSGAFPHMILQVTELNTNAPGFSLEIISGTYSIGDSMDRFSALSSHNPDTVYTDFEGEGFYVHLSARCTNQLKVKANYLSVAYELRAYECDYGIYCYNWGRCISSTLRCDGVNNCGNGVDEGNCPRSTTQHPCPGQVIECNLYGDTFCPSQACDGVQDCIDGSDESICEDGDGHSSGQGGGNSNITTIIPAIIVPVVLALVISGLLMYCMYKRRKFYTGRRDRHRHMSSSPSSSPPPSGMASLAHQHMGVSPPPFTVSANPRYPWAPPSYEASQHHVNMGYTRTMSESAMEHPPPYEHLQATGDTTHTHNDTQLSEANPPQPSNEIQPLNESIQSEISNANSSNMAAAASLSGAGALRPSSLVSLVPQLSPSKRQSSGDVSSAGMNRDPAYDIQLQNVRNLSLEQLADSNHSGEIHEEPPPKTDAPKKKKRKRRKSKTTRAKKQPEDTFEMEMDAPLGTQSVRQDNAVQGDSSHGNEHYQGDQSNAGNPGYHNGAYYLDADQTPDQTHAKESSL